MHKTPVRCQGLGRRLTAQGLPPHTSFSSFPNFPASALSMQVQGACDFMRVGLSWRPGQPGATAIDQQH